jgi:hypothetical protein
MRTATVNIAVTIPSIVSRYIKNETTTMTGKLPDNVGGFGSVKGGGGVIRQLTKKELRQQKQLAKENRRY